MLFENFKIVDIYVAKCFEKRCSEITESNWMVPSAVFVPVVALQIKFSLSSKFLWNLGSVAKTSTHALSISSRKHAIGFLVKLWGPQSFPRYGVKSLHSCSEVCVRVGRVKSWPFTVGVGLQQRCVVSPLLFIVYVHWIDYGNLRTASRIQPSKQVIRPAAPLQIVVQ